MSHFPRQQPGESLFGRAVTRHRQARPKSDEDSLSYSDEGNEAYVKQDEEEEEYETDEDSESDAGTIYSTREAARRTPAQLKKENMIRKQSLLQELIQMKRDGVPLTREYSEDDPIELMNAEINRYKYSKSENTVVGMVKVGINVGFNGIEMLNQWKGKGWVPLKGWAKGMTMDMTMYDDPVRQIVRQQLAKSGPIGNPWVTIVFMVIGSAIFHVMVAKMMHTENGAAMFATMMKNGGIMGTLGNMGGMMNGGQATGGNVGGGTGMPQAVPNVGNPFTNHNVPQVPPLNPNPQVPPPQYQAPPQVPPPPQYRAPVSRQPPQRNGQQKKRGPMKRPSFTRPMHPPSSAPGISQPHIGPAQRAPVRPAAPVHVDNGMGSESTLNLDDDE